MPHASVFQQEGAHRPALHCSGLELFPRIRRKLVCSLSYGRELLRHWECTRPGVINPSSSLQRRLISSQNESVTRSPSHHGPCAGQTTWKPHGTQGSSDCTEGKALLHNPPLPLKQKLFIGGKWPLFHYICQL